MKVLAINSSPNMEKGCTALILNPFLEGLKEAGADVELLYARKLKINFCMGCFNCWFKTPGKCPQKDDMPEVLEKIRQSDILVLATPLYADGMNACLKNIIDRSIPLIEPFIIERHSRSRHPLRPGVRRGKVVLVSSCGFYEIDNFEPLQSHMRELAVNMNRSLSAVLLRPHGPALTEMMKRGLFKCLTSGVLSAAREAGRQFAAHGSVESKVIGRVEKPLLPKSFYNILVNKAFKKRIKK